MFNNVNIFFQVKLLFNILSFNKLMMIKKGLQEG